VTNSANRSLGVLFVAGSFIVGGFLFAALVGLLVFCVVVFAGGEVEYPMDVMLNFIEGGAFYFGAFFSAGIAHWFLRKRVFHSYYVLAVASLLVFGCYGASPHVMKAQREGLSCNDARRQGRIDVGIDGEAAKSAFFLIVWPNYKLVEKWQKESSGGVLFVNEYCRHATGWWTGRYGSIAAMHHEESSKLASIADEVGVSNPEAREEVGKKEGVVLVGREAGGSYSLAKAWRCGADGLYLYLWTVAASETNVRLCHDDALKYIECYEEVKDENNEIQ